MLKTLLIKDYTLIENIQVEFGKGLNIITGETGAGKSIILDAITAVVGGKVDAGMVRRLGDWLAEQRAGRRLTILATTNRPSSLLAMVDRLGLVVDGAICAVGPYEQVLATAGSDMQDYVQVQ